LQNLVSPPSRCLNVIVLPVSAGLDDVCHYQSVVYLLFLLVQIGNENFCKT